MDAVWDAYFAYFEAGIPLSEYLWIVVVFGISFYALFTARRMVSKI